MSALIFTYFFSGIRIWNSPSLTLPQWLPSEPTDNTDSEDLQRGHDVNMNILNHLWSSFQASRETQFPEIQTLRDSGSQEPEVGA